MGNRFLSSPNWAFRPALVTTQLPIQWVPVLFPQRSAALNWNWQLTTPSSEVNNDWSYTPNSHYTFTACTKTNILHSYFDAGVNVNEEFGCAPGVVMAPYDSVAMPNIIHELHINAKFEVPRLQLRRKLPSDTWRRVVWHKFTITQSATVGRDSAVGIATR
jgi:hypothetical protein